MIKLLIVEDDPVLQDALVQMVHSAGRYAAMVAATGAAALQMVKVFREEPLMLVLSLDLPGLDGFAVLKQVAFDAHVAIIAMTAQNPMGMKLKALHEGADAFMAKPLDAEELLLTLDTVRRRVFGGHLLTAESPKWRFVPLNWVLCAPSGETIKLTAMETQLLDLLHRHKGRPVSRGKIGVELGDLYRYSGNALEAMVSRLRRKISAVDPQTHLIKAVSGAGYMLAQDFEH